MLKFTEFGYEDPREYLDQVEKLERLARDMRALFNGNKPSTADLRSAPVIHNWQLMVDFHVSLYGEVRNHPNLPGYRRVMTSPVFVDGRDLGWFRTASRYYLIGKELPEGSESSEMPTGPFRLV